MKHPDDVARLREIKRLLERIQRLPRLAGMPIPDSMPGPDLGPDPGRDLGRDLARDLGRDLGPPPAPLRAPALERTRELALALDDGGIRPNGLHNGHSDRLARLDRHARLGSAAIGPPHPSADADLAPELECEPADAEPLQLPRDPQPPPFDTHRESGRSEYWVSEYSSEPRALVVAQPSSSGGLGISPWVFILATAVNTVVAAVLAIVITLGVGRRETAPAETDKVAAVIKPASEVPPEPPRPIELLPVGSAKEPLRLEAMKPARLPLVVRPEEAMQDSYILLLTGLPPNATLSGASRMGTDSWHLPPGALERLEIVVPEWSAAVFEVGVELRHTNGVVAARTRLWLAVPPPPTPKDVSLDESALRDLVKSGDKLLSRGDVAAARAIYERAAAMGSAQAALAMGTTFDPRRLWQLGVFGMVGNKERARQWYQRAYELGHPDAKGRIGALQ